MSNSMSTSFIALFWSETVINCFNCFELNVSDKFSKQSFITNSAKSRIVIDEQLGVNGSLLTDIILLK